MDKAQALQALQSSGQSYDAARETLKHVQVDASGKLELEDWVEVRHVRFSPDAVLLRRSLLRQLNAKLKTQAPASVLPSHKGKVTVHGSNANVSHTINEDERAEFTNHINMVHSFCGRWFFHEKACSLRHIGS